MFTCIFMKWPTPQGKKYGTAALQLQSHTYMITTLFVELEDNGDVRKDTRVYENDTVHEGLHKPNMG